MAGRPLSRPISLFGMNIALCVATTLALPAPAAAAPAPQAAASNVGIPALSYVDFADLSLRAQVVAGVTATKAERLKGDLAPGLGPDHARFLVTATVGALLRGTEGLPGVINYIVDVPLDGKGRVPKLKKLRFLLIGDRVAGRPTEVRLNSPHSQVAWTQEAESMLRAILTEASSAKAPPPIIGVGNAFHVTGSIPGEGESQIFLTTSNGSPISLSVLRRPGEQPQWAVALGEMVDESAQAPAKDSLLWYRLACFLPRNLPTKAIASLSESDAAAASEDYRFIVGELGPCTRTLPR